MINTVLDASNYIETHLNEPLNIAEIAREMGYSQFYFARIFSEVTHMSLYNYIMRRKVSYGYDLLLHETDKILDVALECGFNSHETFIRAFKRHFNKVPSEVRVHNIKEPLQKQEPLSKEYIEFLAHLVIIKSASDSFEAYFSGEPYHTADSSSHYLTVLHQDKFIRKAYAMQGLLSPSQPVISYPLHLKPIVTLEASISERSFCERFLFEQIENWEIPIEYYVLSEVSQHTVSFYTHNPKNP